MHPTFLNCQVFHTGERERGRKNWYQRGDITESPMPHEARLAVGAKEELPCTASCVTPSTVEAEPSHGRHSPSTPGLTRQREPALTPGTTGRSRSTTSPANLSSSGSNRSRSRVPDWSSERRRRGGRADGVGMLKQIHDLADHLRQHVSRARSGCRNIIASAPQVPVKVLAIIFASYFLLWRPQNLTCTFSF